MMPMNTQKISFEYGAPQTLLIKLSGDWRISAGFPEASQVIGQFELHKEVTRLEFEAFRLEKWDSGFMSFLFRLSKECEHRGIVFDRRGLPDGVRKLLDIAFKVVEADTVLPRPSESLLERIGSKAIVIAEGIRSLLDFLGEIAVGFWRMGRGKSNFRRDEFIYILQTCSVGALPLVSLISILVGVILAFIGAIQLQLFGAQIFIADIVGIAMVRVMGAVMAGILMAGRTGASFAAELGIMQVNEEIDALKTLGVSPVEFLVIPRLLALVVMMPLLALYADFMGILGGFAVSTGVLGLNPVEYWNHTQSAVKISNLWVGLIHSFIFGIIIAVAGCLRGISCGRSAAAVGEATTAAVVEAITWIVIATAVITFICQVFGV